MEEEIANVVQQHGWYAASVSDHRPPFLYTIGLMQNCSHPELIMFGLDTVYIHALFSQLVLDIRDGRKYAAPGVYPVRIDGNEYQFGFRSVDPTQHPLYLGFAMGHCRHIGSIGELEAVQVFWSDRNGKFPFEVGCDLDVFELQPRLDRQLTPREIREWRRQCE